MCTFFFNCHTYTLASDTKLGQPDWMNYWGQFSQKKVWLRVGINRGLVGKYGGVSVTLSNAWYSKPRNALIKIIAFDKINPY
jgi:hypothetical protein